MQKLKRLLPMTLCAALLLSGCGTAQAEPTATAEATAAATATVEPTTAPTTTPETATEPAATEAPSALEETPSAAATEAPAQVSEAGQSADGLTIYAQQIARYTTALSESWTTEQYYDNDMSEVAETYAQGDGLENVGVAFPDLDNDGQPELVIGAIYNQDNDPVIFEIWTTVEGTPTLVAQSHSRSRWFLNLDEAGVWFLDNEASNSAFSSGYYYYTLSEGTLSLAQGIVYDGDADPEAPWYMTDDEDWDVSNDTSIDEETFDNIQSSHANHYQRFDFTPLSGV